MARTIPLVVRGVIHLTIAAAILLVTGVPAFAEPPPLDAYGDLPGIEHVAISPGGAGLAVISRIHGERRLLLFAADRSLRSTNPIGEAKIADLEWIGEDAVLVINHDTVSLGPQFTAGKAELFGGLVVPANGNKPWMVFAKSLRMAKTVRGSYGIRFIDGTWQGFFGGIELELGSTGTNLVSTRPALIAVDMVDNSTRKVGRAAAPDHQRTWLVDDAGVAAATLDFHDDGRWEILNAQGRSITSGVDPTGDIDLIALGRDGSSAIYSAEDDKEGVNRWYEVPLAGGAPIEVFANLAIERVYVDPTNGRLLGYLERGGTPAFYDPAQRTAVHKVYRAFPKLHVSLEAWTPNFSHVVVHTSGNGDSGTWYVVDLNRLKADAIGDDRPRVPPVAVGAISTFSYRATDGLELDGILTLPPGSTTKKLPAVIFPHGGPHTHDVAAFDWWAQAFASRGYAVFQPNFRGSTNRGDAFRRAGYGEWGRKMQSDLSDGLTELARQGIVDPKRTCIMGASYGGYAALAGVTLQRGLYRCAVAIAPVSDLHEMVRTDYRESGESRMMLQTLKESLGDLSTLGEVSPRRFASRADAPVLLMHGKDDTVVPFRQSDAMAGALRGAGKPYELVVLDDEDHWLSRAATRKQMLEAAVAFVEKHNPAQ